MLGSDVGFLALTLAVGGTWFKRCEAAGRPVPFILPGSVWLFQLHSGLATPADVSSRPGFPSCNSEGEMSRPGCLELTRAPLGHPEMRPPWAWTVLGLDGSCRYPRGVLWSTAWGFPRVLCGSAHWALW